MNLTELSAAILNSDAIPKDIKDDSFRISDFMRGVEAAYQLLATTFGDDLK